MLRYLITRRFTKKSILKISWAAHASFQVFSWFYGAFGARKYSSTLTVKTCLPHCSTQMESANIHFVLNWRVARELKLGQELISKHFTSNDTSPSSAVLSWHIPEKQIIEWRRERMNVSERVSHPILTWSVPEMSIPTSMVGKFDLNISRIAGAGFQRTNNVTKCS